MAGRISLWNILVVDDEEDIRDIYEMILRIGFPLDAVGAASDWVAIFFIRRLDKRKMEQVCHAQWIPLVLGSYLIFLLS